MDEQKTPYLEKWREPKYVLAALGIVVLGIIMCVSIVRERIVNPGSNQVAVVGQGKISYQPDIADVILGVQIDRAQSSESAVNQLNEKMTNITQAIERTGVAKADIETQNYSLTTQYDFKDGVQTPAGYDANQKLIVTVRDIKNNPKQVGEVIAVASRAGSNQMLGVTFDVSNMNDLKQQARLLAIQDARSKSEALASAAGVRLGKIAGWYENILLSPENSIMAEQGFGGSALSDKAVTAPTPQVPSGSQDIIIEINLNYEVR